MFHKKKKTSVDTQTTTTVFTKIVKLSYLQTLALNGGLRTAGEIAGATPSTESLEESISNRGSSNFLGNDFIDNVVLSTMSSIPFAGEIAQSLFGKKVSVSTAVDTKNTGWQVEGIWNQPQFDVIRYAIGIKDLTVSRFIYEQVSEVISKPWKSPKEVIKVLVNVDQFIPPQFPPGTYIKYYIKPNIEETDFIQINPIGLPSIFKADGTLVPRIVNFNVEKPLSSKLEDVYISTSESVKEIVFKAELSRPDTGAAIDGYSPVLKSYRILMYPRNGL